MNRSSRPIGVFRTTVLGRDKAGDPFERRCFVLRLWRLIIEVHWS